MGKPKYSFIIQRQKWQVHSKQKTNDASSSNIGTSKESIKESNKEREALSQTNSSKKTAVKPSANPDIKLAIDHRFNEFVRIYGIKPKINGSEGRIFQSLLKTMPIDQVNGLTTGYLSLADEKLRDKGFPIEWMPNHINGLLMAEKKPERGFVY